MSSRHRYVFDTNVIVGGLYFADLTPGVAFLEALEHGELVVSREVVEELEEVLSREGSSAGMSCGRSEIVSWRPS